MNNEKTPKLDGLISLGDIDQGGGCDWDVTEIWYDPITRETWVYSDGGCSCDWAYEDYTGKADLSGPYPTVSQALVGVPIELKDKVLRNVGLL